jgi:hypothetical protein
MVVEIMTVQDCHLLSICEDVHSSKCDISCDKYHAVSKTELMLICDILNKIVMKLPYRRFTSFMIDVVIKEMKIPILDFIYWNADIQKFEIKIPTIPDPVIPADYTVRTDAVDLDPAIYADVVSKIEDPAVDYVVNER